MSSLRARLALAALLLATPVAFCAGPGVPASTSHQAPQPSLGHEPHVGGGSAPHGRQ